MPKGEKDCFSKESKKRLKKVDKAMDLVISEYGDALKELADK